MVSAVVIYLITKCSMREKTWEEVREEKRRQEAAILGQSTSTKVTEKKEKKKKAKAKSPKEKPAPVVSNNKHEEEEEIHKMVEIEPDPEIIEPSDVIRPIETPKKKKLIGRLKNKNEHSLVRPDMETPELFHPVKPPMDDLEIKHERERRRSEAEALEKQREVVEEVMKAEDAVQQSAAPPVNAASSGSGKSKKSKRRQVNDDSGELYFLCTWQWGLT